jgi:hypothetical protein
MVVVFAIVNIFPVACWLGHFLRETAASMVVWPVACSGGSRGG